MRRPPTRMRRPRGTSATRRRDDTTGLLGDDRRICRTSLSRPSGTRLPIDAEVQGQRRPRATPGRRGPTSRRTSRAALPIAGQRRRRCVRYIELVRTGRASSEPERVPGHACTPRPWSTSSPGWIGRLTISRCSSTNLFDKRIDISRTTACGSCTRALVVPGRPRTIGIRDRREVLAIGAACNAPRCSGFDGR